MDVTDASSDLVIDARGVVKSFGKTKALGGLDLTVCRRSRRLGPVGHSVTFGGSDSVGWMPVHCAAVE